jgi:beta propeller repeat protein
LLEADSSTPGTADVGGVDASEEDSAAWEYDSANAPTPDADESDASATAGETTGGDDPDAEGGGADVPMVGPDVPMTVDVGGPDPEEPISLDIGQNACCLSVSGDRAVWSEDGDIWMHTFSTGVTEVLEAHTAEQTDPVLSGDLLVWADDRNGDRDLWMTNLSNGKSGVLYDTIGDQDEPWLDGTTLVFLSRHKPPHTDKEADVWTLDVNDPTSARALTDDETEQSYPHVRGDRVVWTDFRNDPQGVYTDQVDPLENNGDIFGYDLGLDEEFIVTNDPSKQLRPAIDGENVVWLDWRGINPEPKYSEFMVYTRTVSADMVTLGEERLVAWSGWDVPDLWQRPSVLNGVTAWIGAPEQQAFDTAVFAAQLSDETSAPMFVAGSAGILEAVSLTVDGVVWLGAGQLGAQALEMFSGQ